MKYIKTFENTNIDLNYILNDELYSSSDAIELLLKVKNAINNNCIIDNLDTNWCNRTPLIKCAILSCKIQHIYPKYLDIYKRISNELIDAGANIDHLDQVGRSALIWAANRDNINVVNLLIEKGANWNIIDIYGYDFFAYLSEFESINIKNNYPEKYSEYLIKKEADKFNL